MEKPYSASPEIDVLPSHFPIPGMGFLPINGFVLKAKDPVLIDTGIGNDRGEFLKAVESVIDPRELKWVWLTHDDSDHTGNLQEVLEAAPSARLVTHPLAAIRMSTGWPVPMDRVYFLNPGESISVGDRNLTAIRPPLFDNPTTIGLYDDKSGAFFSSDSLGALLPSPAQDADDIPEKDLIQGMSIWAVADTPWIHLVDRGKFAKRLDSVRQLDPKFILSFHMAPSRGRTEQTLRLIETLPDAEPFVGPNQAALEEMMA